MNPLLGELLLILKSIGLATAFLVPVFIILILMAIAKDIK
jgi:hypothetical protein